MTKICWPWKMVARYADGEEIEVGGNSEEDCMERLAAFEEAHGEMTWYSGVCDEDYANGEEDVTSVTTNYFGKRWITFFAISLRRLWWYVDKPRELTHWESSTPRKEDMQ